MKAQHPFLISLAALALTAGCSSTGPNTERGAAAGAAIGALGGAVIGHNVGDGDTGNKAAGAAIGAAAGGLAGAAVGRHQDRQAGTERDVVPAYGTTASDYPQQYPAQNYGGYVQNPPPTPTSEPQDTYTPQPSPNSVWVRGHYEYTGDGRNYQWVPGHWETPPQGARTYVAGHWRQDSQGYMWVPGRWQ